MSKWEETWKDETTRLTRELAALKERLALAETLGVFQCPLYRQTRGEQKPRRVSKSPYFRCFNALCTGKLATRGTL